MMKRLRYYILLSASILFFGSRSLAQEESQFSLVLLANDHIAEVNIEQDRYIAQLGSLMDFMTQEFKTVSKDQKIALHLISHKEGKPTVNLYASPELDSKKQESVLASIDQMTFDNTKIVDFPIAITLNIENGDVTGTFKNIQFPEEQRKEAYATGDLAYTYETTKQWAISEVLPVLSAFQLKAEEQFKGVTSTGELIKNTDFTSVHDHQKLFGSNTDYWRGVMEMGIGNELVSASNIFALVAEGKFAIALNYLQITLFFSDQKSNTTRYLQELYWRLGSYNQIADKEISLGIAEHDKENFQEAINIYNHILKINPHSAWANYELYFTQNAMELKNGTTTMDNHSNWNKAKVIVYGCDPLYEIQVSATNADEAYTMIRRQEINELFQIKSQKLADVYKFADIALDLSVYDFAAQLYWYSFTFSKGQNEMALTKFLYCLEKLGVTDLKENFNGNHEKEFKAVEKERQKAKEENFMYKSFKK
ncbi:MAG: hypothetical protein V4604_01600 [Bacteroidota bacterium]